MTNTYVKGKVHPVTGHEGSRSGVEVQLYSFLNLSARLGWVVNATPQPLYCQEEKWYPSYRMLGGPQGQSGQARKVSPPQRFDPQIIQPTASHCTNYATPVHNTM